MAFVGSEMTPEKLKEIHAKYQLHVQVWTDDWESDEYEDVGAVILDENGALVVTDKDDFVLAMFHPNHWAKYEIDREERQTDAQDEA